MKYIFEYTNFNNGILASDKEKKASELSKLLLIKEYLIHNMPLYVDHIMNKKKTSEELLRLMKAIKPVISNRIMNYIKKVDIDVYNDIRSNKMNQRKIKEGFFSWFNKEVEEYDDALDELSDDLIRIENFIKKKIEYIKSLPSEYIKIRMAKKDMRRATKMMLDRHLYIIDTRIKLLQA